MRTRITALPSWFWLIAALIIVGGISIFAGGPSGGPRPLQANSSEGDGALALKLWLSSAGYRVSESSATPHLASRRAAGSTIMLLARGSDIPAKEQSSLLGWVRRGGRMVVATGGTTGSSVLASLGLQLALGDSSGIIVDQPLLLAPPASALAGHASAVLAGMVEASAAGAEVARSDLGTVLLRRTEGRGEIWVLTAPELLDNAHIALADNRKLALNLAGPETGSVSFDEYVPPVAMGSRTNWLTDTVWGVVVLLTLAVLVLYRWLSGWRLGPAAVSVREGHRAAAEYVISLAGLLRRGRGRVEILQSYQQSLRRAVQARYGDLMSATMDRERREAIEQLLAPPDQLSEAELIRRAHAIVEEERTMRSPGE